MNIIKIFEVQKELLVDYSFNLVGWFYDNEESTIEQIKQFTLKQKYIKPNKTYLIISNFRNPLLVKGPSHVTLE